MGLDPGPHDLDQIILGCFQRFAHALEIQVAYPNDVPVFFLFNRGRNDHRFLGFHLCCLKLLVFIEGEFFAAGEAPESLI